MLNAARFRLRRILHRQLYKTNESLLAATCKCKGDTLWGYQKELEKTGIWPLEETVSRNSINDLLQKLDEFEYKVADKNACMKFCQRNYNSVAEQARLRTEGYFDGLCLDCMKRTEPKLDDHHADYWKTSWAVRKTRMPCWQETSADGSNTLTIFRGKSSLCIS